MAKKKNPAQTVVRGRFIGGSLYEKNDDGKYTACVVLEDGEAEKVEAIRDHAVSDFFDGKKPKLVDWTAREGDDEEYEHSFGKVFVNPKSGGKQAVKVVRRVAGELQDCEDVYPGCYVYISINAYCFKANKEKNIKAGVTLGLRGVQFWKDGERIGGSFDEAEFDGYDSEDMDADAYGEEADSELDDAIG